MDQSCRRDHDSAYLDVLVTLDLITCMLVDFVVSCICLRWI